MRRRMTKKSPKIQEDKNENDIATLLKTLSKDEIDTLMKLAKMLGGNEEIEIAKKSIREKRANAAATKKIRGLKSNKVIVDNIQDFQDEQILSEESSIVVRELLNSSKPQDDIFVINPDKNKDAVRPRIVQAKTGDPPKRRRSAEERVKEQKGEEEHPGTVAAKAEELYVGPRENKFFDMPEASEPNTDTKFDKTVAVQKPVPRGGREANLVEKQCEECKDDFMVNPAILSSKRFVCNDCIVKKGKR